MPIKSRKSSATTTHKAGRTRRRGAQPNARLLALRSDDDVVSIRHLKGAIQQVRSINPSLTDDNAFCFWFIRAFLTPNQQEALSAVCGRSHDKGIDAIWIDRRHKKVHLIQSKFRTGEIASRNEQRDDVLAILEKARLIWGPKEPLQEFLKTVDPAVGSRFRDTIKEVCDHGYSLILYYVTTGKVSKGIRDAVQSEGRHIGMPSRAPVVKIFDGVMVQGLYQNYAAGIAPAVPSITLKIKQNGRMDGNYLYRIDALTGIQSWVIAMSAAEVGEIYSRCGMQIFARNIRGFLGKTPVSEAIRAALRNEPGNFWYYNNGITIICDKADASSTQLTLDSPQIINGQQTTRTVENTSADASVLVKVIAVPRSQGSGDYDRIIGNIVRATNWQSAIKSSDLVTNDRVQVTLEQDLRGFNYQYIRKRQSKREAREAMLNPNMFQITKEEFAQSAAACNLTDSSIVFKGTEFLFSEEIYKRIFTSASAHYYFPRYWLMQRVKAGASVRGQSKRLAEERAKLNSRRRALAKWLVLHFLWNNLRADISTAHNERRFRYICEFRRGMPALSSLDLMVDQVFRAAEDFYIANSGPRRARIDRMPFFKQSGLDERFQRFWRRSSRRARYIEALTAFRRQLQDVTPHA